MGFILAIGAAISFGSVGIFTRIGVEHIKPPGATLIALLSSSIVVTVFTIVLEMEIVRNVSLSGILWFAVIGILYFPLARNFFFLGVNSIGASRTSGIYASYPLFTVIFATMFLKEDMTISVMVGTLCIVGGLVFLATYGKIITLPQVAICPDICFLWPLRPAMEPGW